MRYTLRLRSGIVFNMVSGKKKKKKKIEKVKLKKIVSLNPFPSDHAIWHLRVPPLKFPSMPYSTPRKGQF